MSVGGSYQFGKTEIVTFIKNDLQVGSNILDVGAGGGTYGYYLGVGYNLEAVELWPESVEVLKALPAYSRVYPVDIRDFEYKQNYDLIIFGDVLEHLSIEDAQDVLEEAKKHARHILIGIPYMLEQEAIYENQAEIHLQPDLTPEIFNVRYPGFRLILSRFGEYGYGYYYM